MNLVQKILNELNYNNQEIVESFYSGENWIFKATTIIKTAIAKLGQKEFNCSVSSHYLDIADEGEWVYDLVLYDMIYSGEFSRLKKIHLVVESEFSKTSFGGFKEDFDKLFIASNTDRLFILRKNNQNEFEKIIKYAELAVNDFEGFKYGDSIHIIYWDEFCDKNFKHIEIKKQNGYS